MLTEALAPGAANFPANPVSSAGGPAPWFLVFLIMTMDESPVKGRAEGLRNRGGGIEQGCSRGHLWSLETSW